MTAEQLIQEGRRLAKPSIFLRPGPSGPVAAIWHEYDEDEVESTGCQRWLTVDSRHVPGLPQSVSGFISIFTDEKKCEGGGVEISQTWPERPGTPLYAHPASILPPLDAVFVKGSSSVGEWLKANSWEREWGYNGNFADKEVARAYRDLFTSEHPIYSESDVFAILGGWHFPFSDRDWHQLVDEQLMLMTIRGYEPWVEAWRKRSGQFKVIQRIT